MFHKPNFNLKELKLTAKNRHFTLNLLPLKINETVNKRKKSVQF